MPTEAPTWDTTSSVSDSPSWDSTKPEEPTWNQTEPASKTDLPPERIIKYGAPIVDRPVNMEPEGPPLPLPEAAKNMSQAEREVLNKSQEYESPLATGAVALGRVGKASVGFLADFATADDETSKLPFTERFANTIAGIKGQNMPIEALIESTYTKNNSFNLPFVGPAVPFAYKVSSGLLETAPKLAAVMMSGPASPVTAGYLFGYDDQGKFHPANAVVAAALPIVGKWGGGIAQTMANELGVESETALQWINKGGAYATGNAVIAAQQYLEVSPEWSKMTPEEKKKAVSDGAANMLVNGLLSLGDLRIEKAGVSPEIDAAARNALEIRRTESGSVIYPPGYKGPLLEPLLAEKANILEPTAPLTAQAVKETAKTGEPNASNKISEQTGVQPQRESRNGRGETTETSGGNRVLSPEESATQPAQTHQWTSEEQINETPSTQSTGQDENAAQTGNQENATAETAQPDGAHPPASDESAQGSDTVRTLGEGARLEELKKIPNPTPEQIAERDALQAKSDAAKKADWGEGFTKLKAAKLTPETPATSSDSELYGVSEKIRQKLAESGRVEPVTAGEGIAPKDSVEHGRELLASGTDPEKVMSDFEKTKRFNGEDIAAVRAHGENLFKEQVKAEKQFGINSPEYKAARQTFSDWMERVKPMQTAWARGGHAQQGATDIDTGSFTGLSTAYKDISGKDFNTTQTIKAKEIAKQVSDADAAVEDAKAKLFESAGVEPVDPKVKSIADRIIATLDKTAASALERIRSRRGRLMAGLDPTDLADHVIYGASKIAKGLVEFSKWSAEMAKDLGDYVKPHLQEIFDKSNKYLDEQVAKAAPEQKEKVSKSVRKSEPKTVDEIRAAIEGHKTGDKFTPQQIKGLWNLAKTYLAKGDSFADIRTKMATDLGLSVEEVSKGLLQNKSNRKLTDDVYKAQVNARRLKTDAKIWLNSQNDPMIRRIPRAIMQEAFNLKVLGHLSVGLGTHAPAVFYQPQHWGTFFRNYGNMWRLGLSDTTHEMMMQDLTARDNWTTARRAGLENDPFSHEEYQIKGLIDRIPGLDKLSRGGNRAYDALKIMRQDLFDYHWNKLPESMQTPEEAAAIANDVNHVTGITKDKTPFKFARVNAGTMMFAPRLLASRWAWLYSDPLRAASVATRWNNATQVEKNFAQRQVREKATVLATMGAMLAANQAILTAMGSDQKINFDDPTRSDFLKFKGGGVNVSFGNAMLTTLRLPWREATILYNNTKLSEGKKRGEGADRATYDAIGEYFRNQLNPAAHDVTDIAFQNDAQGRPLPLSKQPVPKYLRRQGVEGPYTWSEYVRDAAMPIPLEESVKQVFNDYGMPKSQADKWTKILGTAIYMGGTGGRVEEDRYIGK